ncbi:MAG: hypothetical protein HKN03_16215 [Acidimicrobiales bacterium]|nr:hypothetical protein [Acidimicrobiales bacterium]
MMDSQEMNKACELAFLVAREGVEQDPPIDPPASMRMFLYVRQFPQRALTVARQTLAEDPIFRARVAAAATVENTGPAVVQWLQQPGVLDLDELAISDSGTSFAVDTETEPVTKEAIRTELDELKSLVGQLADERASVDDELADLETRLDDADGIDDASETPAPSEDAPATVAPLASSAASAVSTSLAAQIRSLHADLKQARHDREAAQEAKELAILEQAEMVEELERLQTMASSANERLNELEAKIDDVSGEKAALESETARLIQETTRLSDEAASVSTERDDAVARTQSLAAEREAAEANLAQAEANLAQITAELDDIRSSAGASVNDLQAAVRAQEALSSHVDTLTAAQANARAEMERVNSAMASRSATDAEKISALQAALASVVTERDALQSKLDLVRNSVNSVQGEMANLDSSVQDAETAASVLGESVAGLGASVEGIAFDEITPADTSSLDTPDAPAPALIEIPEQTASIDSFANVPHEAPAEDPAPEMVAEPDVGVEDEAPDAPEVVSEPEVAVEDEVVAEDAEEPAELDFTAGLLNDFPDTATTAAPAEDIDEVHALVSQTVATFDDAENTATDSGSTERGGLTSLFTSTAAPVVSSVRESEEPSVEPDPPVEADAAPEVEIPVDDDAAAVGAESEPDTDISEESTAVARRPISIPEEIMSDPVAVARHIVHTEDVVLLIDGDPVAAMGWPSVDRIDQRRNLVHFLSALAGSSGAAPDVLFDRDHGVDRLPDSRSVRVRVTSEEGSVAAQLKRLIETYPNEWPVVVVTDNMDLASEVAMKGATILDNGQLLDLFIAS